MPILDVTLVLREGEVLPDELAHRLAHAAARALDSEPAGTWVRIHTLSSDQYAEGDGGPAADVSPVFVSVLKSRLPREEQMRETAGRLSDLIAEECNRPPENVHILFEPDAAGRVWFGGRIGK